MSLLVLVYNYNYYNGDSKFHFHRAYFYDAFILQIDVSELIKNTTRSVRWFYPISQGLLKRKKKAPANNNLKKKMGADFVFLFVMASSLQLIKN